ncbi:MAG: sigma-70 family RNA polymerase sigma factor [Gemmatimonadales bacterium]|nr:sigma-70 family RNA polymerase sigma factor [Gemmatimonadales bacterium]
MRNTDVPESRLAAAARMGDAEAYGRLVLAQGPVARRVAYGILGNWDEADDVVQDAALAGWLAIERFDPDRAFRPWFLRIVSNAALDGLRRRRVRESDVLDESMPSRGAGPDREADRSLLRDRIKAAMAELSERQRVAVMLFDGEGYSHAEIAAVLEVPEGTVRSYVFHARRALRKSLAALVEAPSK